MLDWRIWRGKMSAVNYQLPTVEDSAADGYAMARQAALMELKNRILIHAIRQPGAVDTDLFIAPAGEVLSQLSREHQELAEKLEKKLARARKRSGEAEYGDDYRKIDVKNLVVRKQSLELVAAQLAEQIHDVELVQSLIQEAHSQAWAELSREMERSLDRTEALEFGDEHYEDERDNRLRQFINLDLAQLIEENTPEY